MKKKDKIEETKREIIIICSLKEVLLEGLDLKEDGTYYSPRGKILIRVEDLQKQINFLLNTWAKKVAIYDKQGKKLKTIWQ